MRKLAFSISLFSTMLPAQVVSRQVTPPGDLNSRKNTMYMTSGIAMPGAGAGQIAVLSHEFSMFPGKPIVGAPYSADQITEHVQTLADGNRIVNTTTTKIYRDSQGRTRTETSLPALPGGPPPPVMITIHDPVAGATYLLNVENKTAQKIVAQSSSVQAQTPQDLPALPPPPPPPGSPGMMGPMAIVGARSEVTSNSQSQDLGSQIVEGVTVTGTRSTSTIPAGAIGNEQPIETASERWFSPALQVVVKSIYTDPRIGQTTESLQNLTRAEPNSSLFQVPSDYAVTESSGPQIRTFQFKNRSSAVSVIRQREAKTVWSRFSPLRCTECCGRAKALVRQKS